jgi:hypothetical protein
VSQELESMMASSAASLVIFNDAANMECGLRLRV